jgi:hypothetical protein
VPALAPKYKQHILSPAKVRKECHYLAELYVKSVYLNLFGGGGVKSMEYLYFKGVKKGKAVPLHAMEALGGRGGIAPTH